MACVCFGWVFLNKYLEAEQLLRWLTTPLKCNCTDIQALLKKWFLQPSLSNLLDKGTSNLGFKPFKANSRACNFRSYLSKTYLACFGDISKENEQLLQASTL